MKSKGHFWEEAAAAALGMFTVIERVEEGITVSDSNGHFVIFNSKMGEITGYSMEEANSKKDFLDALYADDGMKRKAMDGIREVLDKGIVENAERVISTKHGAMKTLIVSTSIIRYNNQDMFLSVYRDISDRKKSEQLKSDFVSMVSRELRTPLSIIKEGISLVLDKIPGDINERQQHILNTANSNIDRLSRIINDLLDISRIESGKMTMRREAFDLVEAIKQTAISFGRMMVNKGLELRLTLTDRPVIIYADKDRIIQVISNLLDNAVKFTDGGYVAISLDDAGESVVCTIEDSGMGIPKDSMFRVFEKFEQFSRVPGPGKKGTGLGLSIIKGIIELHGGQIRVESRQGTGTKFTFTLPKR